MIPPDRNIFKTEPKPPSPELSSMEKLVRRLEKDDVLLYLTAFFGVFMPALVYLIYRKVHSMYYSYSGSYKKETKLKSKKLKKKRSNPFNASTLFYCSTNSKIKHFVYELAEKLEFLDPLVVNLKDANLSAFASYKGIAIFVLDITTVSSNECQFFIDWLNEVRYELKQKNLLKWTKFSILNVVFNGNDHKSITKVLSALNKGLCSIGASSLTETETIHVQEDEEIDNTSRWLNEFCNSLNIIQQNTEQNPSSTSDSDISQFSTLEDVEDSEVEENYLDNFTKKKYK